MPFDAGIKTKATEDSKSSSSEISIAVPATKINPRLVFTSPDVFFGRNDNQLLEDLLLEQQEQM